MYRVRASGILALFFMSWVLLHNVCLDHKSIHLGEKICFCAALTGFILLVTELISRPIAWLWRRCNPEITYRSPVSCLSGVLALAYASGSTLITYFNPDEEVPATRALLMIYVGIVGMSVVWTQFIYEVMCFIRNFCKRSQMNAKHLHFLRFLCGALALAIVGAQFICSASPRSSDLHTKFGIIVIALAVIEITYELFVRIKKKCNANKGNGDGTPAAENLV